MKSNDLTVIIEEAEGWIGRLRALKERHDYAVQWDPSYPVTMADQTTGYTAVDMATAAAQGFMDGRDSVVVELPESRLEGNLISNYSPEKMARNRAIEECRTAIIAAGGKVKE